MNFGPILYLYIYFYWTKVFLKLPFAVSVSVLFITIQYAVFRKSFIYRYIYSVFVNCPIDSVTQYSSFH